MAVMLRTFPLTASEEELNAFIAELHRRRTEADLFYSGYGVDRELWHLQRIEGRPHILVFTEMDDRTDTRDYGGSRAPFDTWFKQTVLRLTGVNMDELPAGPPSDEIFAWPPAAE